MHVFLHKCLILVEATGLEGVDESLYLFIYKDLRVFTPHRSPKLLYIFRMASSLVFTVTLQQFLYHAQYIIEVTSIAVPRNFYSLRIKAFYFILSNKSFFL